MTADRLDRARAWLLGLALGDALGSQFFVPATRPAFETRTTPPAPWSWTDDTEMACSVVRVLAAHGRIDQDALAASFAGHHDFDRGYGPSTNRLLRLVLEGGDIDTTCAIVGGVVAAGLSTVGLPTRRLRVCEPLPAWAATPWADGERGTPR